MLHVLYCDLSTMRCSSEDIDKRLHQISGAVCRVNDNLWLLDMDKYSAKYDSPLFVDEYLISKLLKDYITPDSTLMSFTPGDKNQWDWQFPDAACDFWERYFKNDQ